VYNRQDGFSTWKLVIELMAQGEFIRKSDGVTCDCRRCLGNLCSKQESRGAGDCIASNHNMKKTLFFRMTSNMCIWSPTKHPNQIQLRIHTENIHDFILFPTCAISPTPLRHRNCTILTDSPFGCVPPTNQHCVIMRQFFYGIAS
jgi:hypothetical protein